MRTLILLALAALTGTFFVGCASQPPVYPEAVFTTNPKIQTIAVAPFIMPKEAVEMPSRKFEVRAFEATDGTMIYYSVDFAAEYARGLSEFPGITVVMPADVERRWIESVSAGKDMNPLKDAASARALGGSVLADAIIVAQVLSWDLNTPEITMDWQMLATNHRGLSTDSTLEEERSGTGGKTIVDYTKVPVFAQTLTLDANSAATQALLNTYARTMELYEPYRSASEKIRREPWPEYLHFLAWATMSNAYRAHTPKEE